MHTYIKIFFAIVAVFSLAACTKLDEEKFGSLSPDTYYKGEKEALSSVVGVYGLLSQVSHIGDPWRVVELGTDEFVVPGRASGGWFDQSNMDIIQHVVNPANATTGRAWNNVFQEIGTANAILDALNKSPNKDNLKALIAETRALRAYGYFYAMDFWGNVPIVTVARVDPNNLPKNATRSDVFNFVVSEMLAASQDMPSVTTVNKSAYYPRFTREAIYAALAIAYLNAGVYTGTAKWDSAAIMCDKVIGVNAYALEKDLINNFNAGNKGKTTETISSFSIDPTKNAGGNQFILYTQNALDQLKYNLPFIPANGYSTTQEALDRYENTDNRKALIEYGPQFYLNGTPLKYPNGQQLTLIAVKDLISAEDNEGYKVLKYTPVGATWAGFNGNNDLVLVRYAEILLTKAEALFRTGKPGALELVNAVRARSNASPLSTLTIKNIEDERAREFLWEGQRRRDMIRFGSYFTSTWTFKTKQTEAYRAIYPIPAEQLTANPNLKQNPGY
ncbi:MAG: RagB/SusD family nutrient uptake outer membrane protein [Williamsia sp.]|nr:RagB/SusD family nutrient uptake outer membrane protein [Williamsia sp.]